MPLPELKATLTDIGTEELNHLEMIGAIVYQLTKDLTEDEIKSKALKITLLTIQQAYIRNRQEVHLIQPHLCR